MTNRKKLKKESKTIIPRCGRIKCHQNKHAESELCKFHVKQTKSSKRKNNNNENNNETKKKKKTNDLTVEELKEMLDKKCMPLKAKIKLEKLLEEKMAENE